MNRLLAPGLLSSPHAEYEDNKCEKCHEVGAGVPDAKCVACHEQVGKLYKEGKGLHGHWGAGKDCKSCHTEHKGRGLDTTKFKLNSFDHQKTG